MGIHPNARLFFIFCYRFCYRFAIVLEACAGCHLHGSWTCTGIRWSRLVIASFCSDRFLGRYCIGSAEGQAKLKWKARGYSTVPHEPKEAHAAWSFSLLLGQTQKFYNNQNPGCELDLFSLFHLGTTCWGIGWSWMVLDIRGSGYFIFYTYYISILARPVPWDHLSSFKRHLGGNCSCQEGRVPMLYHFVGGRFPLFREGNTDVMSHHFDPPNVHFEDVEATNFLQMMYFFVGISAETLTTYL